MNRTACGYTREDGAGGDAKHFRRILDRVALQLDSLTASESNTCITKSTNPKTLSNYPSLQHQQQPYSPYRLCINHSNLPPSSSSHTPSRPLPLPSKMADKLRTLQQLEALQAKHIGTGHADTTRQEWTSNILRDSYASYIGHPPMLSYMAIGMGTSRELVRGEMIEKMVGAGRAVQAAGEGGGERKG